MYFLFDMLQITVWMLNEYLPVGLLIFTFLTSGRSGNDVLLFCLSQFTSTLLAIYRYCLIHYFEYFSLQIGASLISQLSTKMVQWLLMFNCCIIQKFYQVFFMPFIMINSFLYLFIYLVWNSLTDFTLIILDSHVAFSVFF